MPRSQSKPYQAVLAYFKTAPLAEIEIVQDIARGILADRKAAPAARAAKPGPKPQAPPPAAAVAPVALAPAAKVAGPVNRRKPGPKPGSHRRRAAQTAQGPAQLPDPNGQIDHAEPVGEEFVDPEMPNYGDLAPDAPQEPDSSVLTQGELQEA